MNATTFFMLAYLESSSYKYYDICLPLPFLLFFTWDVVNVAHETSQYVKRRGKPLLKSFNIHHFNIIQQLFLAVTLEQVISGYLGWSVGERKTVGRGVEEG